MDSVKSLEAVEGMTVSRVLILCSRQFVAIAAFANCTVTALNYRFRNLVEGDE